jgi:hypothetical protein
MHKADSPNLDGKIHQITSNADVAYNCIAWAAHAKSLFKIKVKK